MKISLMSIMLLTVLCTSTPVVADVPNVGLAMQIVEARQKNATLMKQYSWESRTELIENGVVKDIRIEQVTYGPGGQVQRALINDQPAALPGGRLRHGAQSPGAELQLREPEPVTQTVERVLP